MGAFSLINKIQYSPHRVIQIQGHIQYPRFFNKLSAEKLNENTPCDKIERQNGLVPGKVNFLNCHLYKIIHLRQISGTRAATR